MARSIDRLTARRLYVEEGKTIEQISVSINVPRATLYRWKDEEGWDKDREMLHTTSLSALRSTYLLAVRQLEEMVTAGKIDARQADAFNKIISGAKRLSSTIDKRANILDGFEEFVSFMEQFHSDALKEMVEFIIEFRTYAKNKFPA